MLRLLGVVFLLMLIVGAFGYHQGWFAVAEMGDPQGTHYSVSLDRKKIEADREYAKQKLNELENKVKEKTTPSR